MEIIYRHFQKNLFTFKIHLIRRSQTAGFDVTSIGSDVFAILASLLH